MQFIRGFADRYQPLSNSWMQTVIWQGTHYPSAEHAFIAGKMIDPNDRKIVTMIDSVEDARSVFRNSIMREGWEEGVSVTVMRDVLKSKFKDEELRRLLLTTFGSMIIYDNELHDQKWGNCVCGGRKCDTAGVNLLGVCLMDLRIDIRNKESKRLLTLA